MQIGEFRIVVGDTGLPVFPVDIEIPATQTQSQLISGTFQCVTINYIKGPSLWLQRAPAEQFIPCLPVEPSDSDDEGCVDNWMPNPLFHRNKTGYIYIRPGFVGLFFLHSTETIYSFDGLDIKTNTRTGLFIKESFVFSDQQVIAVRNLKDNFICVL